MTVSELFNKGCYYLRSNNTLAALSCFEKAYGFEKSPAVKSYLGLCLALERGQLKESIALCTEALSVEPDNPVHYLNLGKVYIKADKKSEAIETLRKGLSHGDNEEIRVVLDKLGTRMKPLFPFLRRSHILNKYAGMALRALRLR